MSDFLPARRPLWGRGWGDSLPGRCCGPFRPISTPGGRCCSLTGLGPRTPVPLPYPGAALPDLRCNLLLGRSATSLHPLARHPETFHPLGPGPGGGTGPAPSPSPSLRTPGWAAPSPTGARPHPDTHTHLWAAPRPPTPAAWTRSRGDAPFPVLYPHLAARCRAARLAPPLVPRPSVTFRRSASSRLPTFPNADESRPSTGVAKPKPFPILPLTALTPPVPTVEKDLTPGASSSLGNCRNEQTKQALV